MQAAIDLSAHLPSQGQVIPQVAGYTFPILPAPAGNESEVINRDADSTTLNNGNAQLDAQPG
jgi:hypothetical protein